MRKSLFGGYPHEGIKTEEVFPNRIHTKIIDEKVKAIFDLKHYPHAPEFEPTKQTDFLLDRLHDVNTALGIAEQQIRDMQAEYPFIPQDFGFDETTMKLTDEGFSPTCYAKGRYMVARIEDTVWMITGVAEKGLPIDLPNSQIAFLVLRSLGVIADKDFEDPLEYNSEDVKPEELSDIEWEDIKKKRKHLIKFGQGLGIWSEEKQKFIIPNNPEYPERLWGTELTCENFEWIREEGSNGTS